MNLGAVEAVRRGDGGDSLLFVLNHTDDDVTVPLYRPMTDLLIDGAVHADTVSLGRYGSPWCAGCSTARLRLTPPQA